MEFLVAVRRRDTGEGVGWYGGGPRGSTLTTDRASAATFPSFGTAALCCTAMLRAPAWGAYSFRPEPR